MAEKHILFWMVQALIILFAIAIGHSILLLRLRKEENRRRELELTLLERRTEVLKQGRKVVNDLEEVLYKTQVQQEIDDMIRKE